MREWRLPIVLFLATVASFLLWPFVLTLTVNELLVLAERAPDDAGRRAAYAAILDDRRATPAQRFAAAAAAGQCAKRQGGQLAAVDFFQAALAEEAAAEWRGSVQLELADSLLLLGRTAEAAATLGELVNTVANAELRRVARERYAVALAQVGDLAGAVAQYEKLLADAPAEEMFNLRIQLIQALTAMGETARARQALVEAQPADDEQRATCLWTKAQLLAVAGEAPAAREAFLAFAGSANVASPQQADAWLQIASLDLREKDVAQADESLRRAADLGADRQQLALRLAEAAKHLPPAEADALLAAWQGVAASQPAALVFLLKERGRLALEIGDRAKALALFTQARDAATDEVDRAWLDETIAALERGETN